MCGLLATLVFTLWPLAAIGRIPPGALWRDVVSPAPRRLAPLAAAATAIAASSLAAAIVLSAPEPRFALWYLGGAVVAFALFRVAAWLVTAAARHAPSPRHPLPRLALANLHRPGGAAARIVVSLGIGLSVMIAVALVQGNLAAEIGERLADGAPADFYIDIQPDQLAGFERIVAAVPGARFEEVPMLRGRITRLNGMPVERAEVAQDAEWALRNERGLTYAAAPPKGSQHRRRRMVAARLSRSAADIVRRRTGAWHGARGRRHADGQPARPRDHRAHRQSAADRMDPARHQFRHRLRAGHARSGAADPPRRRVRAAGRRRAHRGRRSPSGFPNVTAIPVREALAAVAAVVERIGDAVRAIASVTLAAGVLVLGGAIAAGHRRRVYDAVLLKVLGATPVFIAGMFLVEHLLLGLVTASVAAGVGTLAAWALVTGPMRAGWTFLPWPLLLTASGAVGLTIGLGLLGTWRALGAKPAHVPAQRIATLIRRPSHRENRGCVCAASGFAGRH